MQSKFRRIQTLLTPLRVFEAAARAESFTKAANELGMRQPSVSRHIANLEADLGVALFERNHNNPTLTRAGRDLAHATDLGLTHIQTAVENVAATPRRAGLTLACSFSFAHGWLLPRFSDLRRATGQAPIHLVVSYWLEDLKRDDVDLVVNWRSRDGTDWPSIGLFDEVVYPVCAPNYLRQHPHLAQAEGDPNAILSGDLLHYAEREHEFVGWEHWFAHLGQSTPPDAAAYRHSNYHFMIQAAMDGEGVALGWHHLVADQIAAGRLSRIGPALHYRDAAYSLEYRPDLDESDLRDSVLDWFRAEADALPTVDK
ncbi:LysR family transcriptional regulator [Shimia abyssi]|uniref:LysR family transcriptional regulator n=1 Tax=Shimia abyssi TaxID=1662395 RepID=A0A2P8FKC3_9RHOB|nr:LysR family transcriptional regulator [Shimia abyssi]PSL22166.1 LysR family transcriptional regulator [Shimia abyssi]